MKTREDIKALINEKKDRIAHLEILKKNCRNVDDFCKFKSEIKGNEKFIKALEWVINE